MSTVIDSLERSQLRRVPRFGAGDRLRVHFQVTEGTRRRTQVFEGVVIKRQGHGARETFTVRKQSFGVGVERTFPLHSPKIDRIEVAARGDVRRAKLYYLRARVGKRARVRERRSIGPEELVDRELLYAESPEAEVEESPEAEVEESPEAEVEESPEAEVEESPEAEVEESPEAEVEESPEAEEPEADSSEEEAHEGRAPADGEPEASDSPMAAQDAGPAAEETAGEEKV